MKKIGIALIALQGFAVLGGMEKGSVNGLVPGAYLRGLFTVTGLGSVLEISGYFLPLIVGIVLIAVEKKKNG